MTTTNTGLYFDDRGSADTPAVLLIEGYGGQLIGWRDAFCDLLIERGLRVLRMDNRDIGLSRHHHDDPGYSIADMASDVVEVLDHAGIAQATIVGQSMGGLIAQHVALDFPDRVRSVVLFYTAPSLAAIDPGALEPTPPQPTSRPEAVQAFLTMDRATASPVYGYDEEWKRKLGGEMFDRDPLRDGVPRQREAIASMPDLTPRLHELQMPIAVIHGRDDAVISPAGALTITAEIPQAELHLFPGMGHEVPPALWNDFVPIIARTAGN
jgi:pimeloyl-ACP methyl ester carboxylesterase